MKFYLKRIINDKIKSSIIIYFFIIMILDLLPRIQYFSVGGTPMQSDFNVFLALTGNDMFLHGLLFWFLPMYLLILSAEDIIEDYSTGYRNILIALKGKKSYVRHNYLKAFILSFGVIFLSLLFNLLFSHIIFSGATHSPFAEMAMGFDESHLLIKSLNQPMITNLIFILVTALLSGIVGMTGTALALGFHNRKLVYPFSFVLWFIPFSLHKSIMLSIQPYSEYDLNQILPTYVFTLLIHLIISLIMYLKVTKYEKI